MFPWTPATLGLLALDFWLAPYAYQKIDALTVGLPQPKPRMEQAPKAEEEEE